LLDIILTNHSVDKTSSSVAADCIYISAALSNEYLHSHRPTDRHDKWLRYSQVRVDKDARDLPMNFVCDVLINTFLIGEIDTVVTNHCYYILYVLFRFDIAVRLEIITFYVPCISCI